MKPLLVGECNPLSDDPRHALYPYPPRCSGARLQELVMGISVREYLHRFDRVDLCVGKWSMPAASVAASRLRASSRAGRRTFVLLGAKVAEAFCGRGYRPSPFTVQELDDYTLVVLPHPSGLCRLWAEPGAFERAREVLRRAGVLDQLPAKAKKATAAAFKPLPSRYEAERAARCTPLNARVTRIGEGPSGPRDGD